MTGTTFGLRVLLFFSEHCLSCDFPFLPPCFLLLLFFTHQFLFNWFAFIRPAVCIIHYFLFITMRFGQFAINRHCCFISLSRSLSISIIFVFSASNIGLCNWHMDSLQLNIVRESWSFFHFFFACYYNGFSCIICTVCCVCMSIERNIRLGLNTSVCVVLCMSSRLNARRKKCSCCLI